MEDELRRVIVEFVEGQARHDYKRYTAAWNAMKKIHTEEVKKELAECMRQTARPE